MTQIDICGYGISIDFWKHEVHGYFTKNETTKRFIRTIRICVGKTSTPRINFYKEWTPLYKIIITWDNPSAEVWNLILLLNQTKGIKFKILSKGSKINVFCRLPDNIRNNISHTIESLSYNNSGYGSSYDEGEENYKYFKTETVVEKW